MKSRRTFIKKSAALAGAWTIAPSISVSALNSESTNIACQGYTWFSFLKRQGVDWMTDYDTSMEALLAAGFQGYEPSFENKESVSSQWKAFQKHGIWCKSMYANSILHEPELVEKNIQDILDIATAARQVGINILVTNPTPIRWGGPENKNDQQLKTQSIALNLLGQELKKIGITLAYHNHDAEMREGAREFHHMLTGTDPENVKLCLDAHWIYRGSGNSQVALFDIVELYADRVVELHIRQSKNGIWTEVFQEGDIDYSRLATVLLDKKITPHVVLEQAAEEGTPKTMDAVIAISKSLQNAKVTFKDFI